MREHHDHHVFLDLDEADLEDKPPSLLHKILIGLGAVFMTFLLLSYLFPLQKIGSNLISERVDDTYSLNLEDGTLIVFSENVYNLLSATYNVDDKEFKVCLKGSVDGSLITLDDYYLPKIISRTFMMVRSEACDNETIVSMHSHPSGWCYFSKQDIRSYENLKERNPEAFIGLICGVDRFNFYKE
ncbi:hypothetical protein GOV05_04065 [Candidatus Woesearchaeota archaeon]|nr:hypothetical protein [Candidatus Woesearchaeota archaeon]